MYLVPILFLIILCDSAHSIGSQSLVSKNLYEPSHNDILKNISIGEIKHFQFNNDNFANLSPKFHRKTFGLLYNIWSRIRNFGRNTEKLKDSVKIDWVEFLKKISELNELEKRGKYSEALKRVEKLTKGIDELTISGSGMIVSGGRIRTLTKGISIILNPGGKNVIINGKIFNDYHPIKWLRNGRIIINKNNNTRVSEDSMLLRFFKKLGEINTLFKKSEFREAQKELKLITKGIDRLIVNDELVISGDIIGRITEGITLVFGSEAVVINGKFLRYKANGIKFEAGGPVFFNGEKISETSKKISSLQRINGKVYINNILIEKGKFYDF